MLKSWSGKKVWLHAATEIKKGELNVTDTAVSVDGSWLKRGLSGIIKSLL